MAQSNPDVQMTDIGTKLFFNFIFDNDKADKLVITTDDKDKALEIFTSLIDMSCTLNKVVKLYSFNRPSFKNIAKKLFKIGTTKCNNEQYAEAVRKKLALNWKSAYAIRVQTGEW